MLIRVLAVVLIAMESGATELHGDWACESGEIAGVIRWQVVQHRQG